MYYFFHGTSLDSFENILKENNIFASYYLGKKQKKYIRMNPESKYVFTNIYVNGLPLRKDEKAGFGRITFIIDPIVLKYVKCYFNDGWYGNVNKNSILMNYKNIDYILEHLKKIIVILIFSHMKLYLKKIYQ
jgi:hypothetical protein